MSSRSKLLGAGALLAIVGIYGCDIGSTAEPSLYMTASPRSINAAGEVSDIRLEATDKNGKAGTGSVSITATAGAFDTGGKTATVTLAAGKANIGFSCNRVSDSMCAGTVTLSATWGDVNGTVVMTVGTTTGGGGGGDGGGGGGGGTDGGPDGGGGGGGGGSDGGTTVVPTTMGWESTLCSGVSCPVMGIQGSGLNELALVAFKVTNSEGLPAGGATVAFTLTRPPLGTVLLATSAVSNAAGQAIARVRSGPVIGSFSVHAQVTGVAGATIEADSATIGVRGAKPANKGFVLQCSPVNVGAYASPTPPLPFEVGCVVQLTDRYNNPVGTGTPVNLKSEAGAIPSTVGTKAFDPKAPSTDEGRAAFKFSTLGTFPPVDVAPLPALATQFPFARQVEPQTTPSGSTLVRNPRDGLVTLLAYLRGEEHFDDNNANGVHDATEPFIDQGEAFVDSNDNNQWDLGEIYVDDAPANGVYDGPNGTWDANTTIWTEARILYSSRPELTLVNFVLPSNWLPCPGGPGRGTATNGAVFFPDFQLNTVQADKTNFGVVLFPSIGAVLLTTPPSFLDTYGFGIERRLMDASTYNSDCSASTPICRWKMLFYGWSRGQVPSLRLVNARTDPGACSDQTVLYTTKVLDAETTAATPITGLQ